jgi:hypothetical protein
VSLEELLDQADYLVIQAPLTKETHHLIGESELRRMKPTAILINTARGPIVSDQALYQALSKGWIAGAGLDDIEEEPAKQRDWAPANPLFGLDNVIITPHAAYYSEEAIHTVRDFAASEVVRVLTGQPPLSAVNAAQVASTRRAADTRLVTVIESGRLPGISARRDMCASVRRGRPGRTGQFAEFPVVVIALAAGWSACPAAGQEAGYE